MAKQGILTVLFSSLFAFAYPSLAEEATEDSLAVTKNKIDVSEKNTKNHRATFPKSINNAEK